ncbi:MAG: ATP-binding protein [Anaerolineales bacterium]|nr:ATP-binding protein [Anaerolineales bacterium]
MDSALRNLPPEPRSVEETGLNMAFLADLALKTMYTRGFLMGHEIAEAMKLPFTGILDKVLDYLRREHLCEVKGSGGFGESSYQYVISDEGRARARELMEQNQYVGPAPVRLEPYVKMVQMQSFAGQVVTQDALARAFSHLVINKTILDQLGPAINSGKSIFLFGAAGNGKTAIAEAIGTLLPGAILIPYAVTVDSHVIKIFDVLHHQPIPEKTSDDDASPGIRRGERYDRRWMVIRRPLIVVGGELMLENLDLVYDPTTKYYEAPYQMKANGGVFLVDDFGRQQVRPRELLNRWIVPLEKRVDFLALATGHKIDVPFDALIIFSTNLNPEELVDEAFLRRIRYKINVADPSWEEYREIFTREAARKGIPYSEEGLRYIVMEHYVKPKRKPRAVHPRDILDELVDIARFRGLPPALTKELMDLACQTYFLKS